MTKEKFTQGEWLLDGLTVYQLNEIGVNEFSALVKGNGRNGADPKKLLKIAKKISAADDMYRALRYILDYSENKLNLDAKTTIRAALAKADKEF